MQRSGLVALIVTEEIKAAVRLCLFLPNYQEAHFYFLGMPEQQDQEFCAKQPTIVKHPKAKVLKNAQLAKQGMNER
jgi:hypothetical protein